jgi:hypothetical protein
MRRIFVLSILFSGILYSFALAASPVLFFSDLADGPKTGWNGSAVKGAAVSIWGKNFGSSRGASYVTVAGQNLTDDADYAEWGVATNNAGDLERITFYLESACANGAGTISVTVGGVVSNTLSFYVRATGSIYFVDHTNGNDASNGTRDTDTGLGNGPWKTLAYARQNIAGGDILYIRSGTYNEADSYNSILYVLEGINGAANNYTAFAGYPGEFPVLDGTVNGSGGVIRNNYRNTGYTVISKMKLLPFACGVRINESTVGYYRITGIEIDGQNTYPTSDTAMVGAIDPHDVSNFAIYGNKVHHWGGSRYDHGIYLGNNNDGTALLNFNIGWNEFYNLRTDVSGIYIHPKDTDPGNGYADEIDIHDNLCYNLQHSGIHIASRVQDVRIYNNIVYNCGSASGRGAIHFNNQAAVVSDILFYNNTVYSAADSAVVLFQTASNVAMKNNIVYSLSSTPYYADAGYTGTRSSDYDFWYGNGAVPGWATHSLNVDPLFFNTGNNDFHLQSTSPAKDAGTADVSAVVSQDYDGISRPQAAGYDVGAYEYAVDAVAPSAVSDLAAGTVTSSTIALTWSAPGNDGSLGQAASYDVRYSVSNISTAADWNTATQVSGEPSPSAAGSLDVLSVSGLSAATTYYFALKTADYAGNVSAVSNITSATTSIVVASSDSGGGGGGGGCFIATAAYGSVFADEVIHLSRFRDSYLLTNAAGRRFVNFYWKLSPPIARYIENKEWAKGIIRQVLRPTVYFAGYMLKREDRRKVR